MATLRRVAPAFSFLWIVAAACHLFYFQYKSSVNRIPDCVGSSCGGEMSDAPPLIKPRGSNATAETTSDGLIHIVYASDDEGLPAVEASIRSAMNHSSEPVVFHFVGDTPLSPSFSNVHYYNLTEVGKKYRLKEFTNPRQRGVEMLAGLNRNLANFVRFVIPDLLPPNASKAMWVDHDTIFECDMVPMIRSALTTTPYAIAAVPVKGPPHGVKKRIKNTFVKNVPYTFNAGVYVVDLNRWRSQQLTKKIRKLTLKNRKKLMYNYGSQPPLVLTIGDKFEHLSPAWNVKVNKLNLNPNLQEKACLLHWSGKRKPWNTFGDPDIHNHRWIPYANSTAGGDTNATSSINKN